MKHFILIADGLDKGCFQTLKNHQHFEVNAAPKIRDQAELEELLPKAEALVIRSKTQVDANLLEKSPNLKYVIRAGEGTDNIDKKLCALKGIKVSNTPGCNSQSAAEHAIALIFSLIRQTPQAHQSMKEGNWDKSLFQGCELTGKTLGIVGLGRIGQIVAERLKGFNLNVVFYDPILKTSPHPDYQSCTLEEVFEKSDFITLHVPLTQDTKDMVNHNLLSKMKPNAFLINASRGGVVHQEDLATALKNNTIKGAALDVFQEEPLPANSPLRELTNIILTPHLGASTAEAQLRVSQQVIKNLEEFFIHQHLINEVQS